MIARMPDLGLIRALSAMLVVLIAVSIFHPSASVAGAPSADAKAAAAYEAVTAGVAKTKAEADKARAEATKTRHDDSVLARVLTVLAPVLTAIIAAGGLLLTARTAVAERRDARAAADQATQDTEVKRFDERFAAAAEKAASDHSADRRAGAVLLGSMAREQGQLSDQAINLLLALLQFESSETDDGTVRLLVLALERALKDHDGEKELLSSRFSFTHLRVPRINLAKVNLTGADLAFSTLKDVDLTSANLERSRSVRLRLGRGAKLHGTRLSHCKWQHLVAPQAQFQRATLVGAELRHASLHQADFYLARLQEADLRDAQLTGARFQQADLRDTNFAGARFDDTALQSVLKAKGWESARWDDKDRERLEPLRVNAAP
jgi:uncharacterized protein YjbI with pentapeptide repeats